MSQQSSETNDQLINSVMFNALTYDSYPLCLLQAFCYRNKLQNVNFNQKIKHRFYVIEMR